LHSHSLSGKGPAAYDEIARVPLIIRGPDRKPAVYDRPVSLVDLAPTILGWAGVDIPNILEGRSLLPALDDQTVGINDAVFIEFGRYEIDHDGFGGLQPMRAVADQRYKLVINLLSEDELYDNETDPNEMRNLIAGESTARIRDALHDRLMQWMNDTRDPWRGYYWERRPWRADARPATWDYTLMTRQREHEEYEPRQYDYRTGLPMTEPVRIK